jgi:hypothetical protein
VTTVLIIVFVALIAAGAVIFVRQRRQVGAGAAGGGATERSSSRGLGQADAPTQARTSVRGLQLGDVVAYEGHDCIVERTYRFSEGGSTWEEHLLVDGAFRRWLSVEDDEGLECVLWERQPDPTLEPGPKTIDLGGVSYRFDEQGTADYTLEESAGPGGSGRAEYSDYVAGEQRLSFERYDGSGWEVNVGAVVSEHVFDVYPGSGEVPI